jgi:hypothetical protein
VAPRHRILPELSCGSRSSGCSTSIQSQPSNSRSGTPVYSVH